MSSSLCKFCGHPITPTATKCENCGAGTPYGLSLDEDRRSRPVLIKCPACQADVSNQALACPRCGQPIQPDNRDRPAQITNRPIPRPKTKHNPFLIGCLLIICVVAACVIFTGIMNSGGSRNSGNQNSPSTIQTNTSVNAAPAASTDDSPDFTSDTSRQILGAFFIKPVLKQMLNDPDSLQDLEVVSVTPAKKVPGVYKAIVTYRARNAFGGLVAQRQTFMVTRGVGNGLDAWRVTPVKN